jgi:hypothetical protein
MSIGRHQVKQLPVKVGTNGKEIKPKRTTHNHDNDVGTGSAARNPHRRAGLRALASTSLMDTREISGPVRQSGSPSVYRALHPLCLERSFELVPRIANDGTESGMTVRKRVSPKVKEDVLDTGAADTINKTGIEWGKPIYPRAKRDAVTSNIVVIDDPGMLRGGSDNTEAFNDKGPGLRNPQSVVGERKDYLEASQEIAPLQAPPKPPTLEEVVRGQFEEEKRLQQRERAKLGKILVSAPESSAKTAFEKDVKKEMAWRRSIQVRAETEPTPQMMLAALDENPVFADCLTEAEWGLWKLVHVFGWTIADCLQLCDGVRPNATSSIYIAGAKIGAYYLPAQRAFLALDFSADADDDLASSLQKKLDSVNAKIMARANWYVEFRYPRPTEQDLNLRREYQKLALERVDLQAAMTDEMKILIPIWIDLWWNGRAAAKQVGIPHRTAARIIEAFLKTVGLPKFPQRNTAIAAFNTRSLPGEEMSEPGVEKNWSYEIALALKAAPKAGETWGQAFGGATIRSSRYHGEDTFERWGKTHWTDGSNSESYGGAEYDDFSEESAA